MSKSDEYSQILTKIDEAKKTGRPTAPYVRRQIELLQEAHDTLIRNVKSQGYDLRNFRVAQREIQIYAGMKQLAEEIGDPVQQYDERIKEIQIRVMGEENYRRFFDN